MTLKDYFSMFLKQIMQILQEKQKKKNLVNKHDEEHVNKKHTLEDLFIVSFSILFVKYNR